MVLETIKRVSLRVPDPVFIILTGLNGTPRKIYERCGFVPVSNHVGAIKLAAG